MDFNLSEEQKMLGETVQRLIAKDYGFEKRRQIVRSSEGFSREVWKQFAELGLLALPLPETHGGMGGGAIEILVLMQSFGRGLVVEPYLATVLLCGGILAHAGTSEQQEELLPRIGGGELLMAFAHFEPGGRYERARATTTARKDKVGWRLSGAKAVVLHGDVAEKLIVSARTSGGEFDAAGISLFLIDANQPGVTVRGYATHDGQRAAEITLRDVQVGAAALLGREGEALPVIERALDRGIAALCAEAVGIMDALNEATLEYTKARKQFGVPIATFQALQHRMADMRIAAELARSMAIYAAAKADGADAPERSRAMSAAKTVIGQSARLVGQQAVQLHGGMGVTDELNVGHYFKRLTLINATFGDADHHLGQYSDLIVQDARPAENAKRRAA
jgi:alkylation response protein AidB-like acyl-CoA dehydrogenase